MHLSDMLFWALVAAGVFMLVRPGSPGPAAVAAIGAAAATLISTAVGPAVAAAKGNNP